MDQVKITIKIIKESTIKKKIQSKMPVIHPENKKYGLVIHILS